MAEAGMGEKVRRAAKRPLGLVRGADEDQASWRRRCKKAQTDRARMEDPAAFAERSRAASARHYANHGEKRRAQAADYKARNCDAVRRRDRARKAEIRQEDPERLREINRRSLQNHPEKIREYNRRNYARNAPTFIAHNAKRRAARRQAVPAWADLRAIHAVYQQACRLTRETGVQHHVDHIVPLCGKSVCGLHVANNLQILTASENLKKGNRHDVGQ